LDRCLEASAIELASHQAALEAAAAAVREAADAAEAAAEAARQSGRVSAEERARLEGASADATRVAEAARTAQEASARAAAAAEQRVAEQQRAAEAAAAALRTELDNLRQQVATAEAARKNATREAETAANETRRTQAALAAAQAQGSASQADIDRLTAAVAAATTREQAAQVAERAARARIAQVESGFATERGQATTDLVFVKGIIRDLYQFLLDKNDQLGDEKIDLPDIQAIQAVDFNDELFAKLRDLLNKFELPQQAELERLRGRITELESQLRESEVNKVFIKEIGSLFGIEDTDFTQLRTRLLASIRNSQQAFVDKNRELKTLIKKVLLGLRGFLEGSGITVTDLNFPDDPNDATITALMGQINTKKRERDAAIENAKQAELDAAQARVEAAEARAAAAEAAIQTERQRASAAVDTAGQKTVDAEAATRRVAHSNQLLAAAEARVADAEARANEAEARANEAEARANEADAATASKDLITPCLLNTLHFILFSQFNSGFVTFLKGLYDTIPKEDLPVINGFFLKTVMSIKARRTVPGLLDNSAEIDRLIQPGSDSGQPVSPRIGVGAEARAEVSETARVLTDATQYTRDMIPTFEHFVGRVDFFKHKFTPGGLEVSETNTKSMVAVTMLFLASFHGQVNSDEFKARLGEAGCEYQEPTYTESTYPGQAAAAPVVRVDSDAELARRRAASAAAAPVPQPAPSILERFGLGVPPPTTQAPLRISTPREAPASAASSPRSPRSPGGFSPAPEGETPAQRVARVRREAAAEERADSPRERALSENDVDPARLAQALAQGRAAAQGQAAAQQPRIQVIPTPGWKPPRGAERSTALQVNPVALGRQREDLQGPASATTGQAATNKKFQVRRY
jgi:polyhydroxyalkanoate synthesis regulator phasin